MEREVQTTTLADAIMNSVLINKPSNTLQSALLSPKN